MELLQNFFATALVAVFFSFLIAKLVSMALCGDNSSCGPRVKKSQNVDDQDIVGESTQDLQYGERLQVEKFESEKRVEFIEEGVQLVDNFFEGSVEIEKVEKSIDGGDVSGAECCDLPRESIEHVSKEDEELSEDISGNNGGEFQVNSYLSVKFDGDKSAVAPSEGLDDEKERGVDEHLLLENLTIGTEFSEKDVVEKSEEIRAVQNEVKEKADDKKIEIDSDDDDWEGIERSELENVFAEAAKFVESGGKDEILTSAGSDVQMQLYGLHKVATEGPCREQPPIALKVAARAKWNAWQRLGNMTPEVAMEQYIALVSDKVPGWKEIKSIGDSKLGSSKVPNIGIVASGTSTFSSHDPNFTGESLMSYMNEEVHSSEKNDSSGGPTLKSRAKE